jgi:hypothetical protein
MRVLGSRKYDDISTWFDSYGMLTQASGDCGDPNNTFLYYVFAYMQTSDDLKLAALKNNVAQVVKTCMIAPGVWIRHPDDGTSWHTDPKEFSRDQWVSLVIMLALYGFHAELKATYDIQCQNNGKFQNADYALPLSNWWALYYRALGIKTWKIAAGDFFMWLESLYRVNKANKDFDDVGDDKNMVAEFVSCELWGHTTWSRRALDYYRKNRPTWFFLGSFNQWEKTTDIHYENGAQYAWDRYFRPETGAPPLSKFVIPTLSNLFQRT